MGNCKKWCTPGIDPGTTIIYVNDLPRSINQLARPVIYADDTSVLVTAKNLKDLQTKLYNISLNGFHSMD
jgi:hypothetical protein